MKVVHRYVANETRFEMVHEDRDILDLLEDLHKQATTDNSHFYTAKVIRLAHAEIFMLRFLLKKRIAAVSSPAT